jgi:hypothetical protein
MALLYEVPLAAIALILTILSYRTLRAIKHLNVGKAFWIPVLISGIFFFSGSIIAISSDLGFSFNYMVDIASISRLLALCILLSGIYMYSRKITKNLAQKFILPTEAISEEKAEEIEVSESVIERVEEKETPKIVECKHSMGYLRTLPKDVPIPEECLSCEKIIECKHSYLRKSDDKSKSPYPASHTVPEMNMIDTDAKEEFENIR